MTPQNEAQMNEEFEKYWRDAPSRITANFTGLDKYDAWKVFKAAYTLQQEKIEKLEREAIELKKKVQMNIHNSAFNGAMEENKELKSDLDWACRGLGFHNGKEMGRLQDIVKKHKLDEVEE